MTEIPIGSYLDWSTRGRPAIWRYVLAVVLTVAVMLLAGQLISPLVKPLAIDPTLRTVILTFSFLPGFVAAPLMVKWVLGRPAFSVALPAWPGRWREYILGLAAGWIVLAATFILSAPYTQFHFHGFGGMDASFFLLLMVMVVGFVFQTGFEELAFRGLIMQGTRVLTGSPWAVLLVQAILFAALHIPNLKGYDGNLLVMTPYLLAALVFGWAAMRSGSLLLPMGLHLANNTFLNFIISMEGDVIGGTAPMSIAPHTLTGIAIFGLTQAALEVGMIELLVRRGHVGAKAWSGT